jgi:hypothetical protein
MVVKAIAASDGVDAGEEAVIVIRPPDGTAAGAV